MMYLLPISSVLILTTALCNVNSAPAATEELGESYANFAISVNDALIDFEDPNTGRSDNGNTVESDFGVKHILASVNEIEKTLPTATPGFETALKSAKNLPEAFQELLSTISSDKDIKITNTLYTNAEIADSSVLTKLGTVVKKMDLKATDAATQVNDDISKNTDSKLQDAYIPSKATLPQSTKAMLVNTLSVTETWSSPLTKGVSMKFNGVEDVDMYELKGAFPYIESDNAIQVTIPFQNDKRALVLVVPNNYDNVLKGNLGEPKNGTKPTVRIQIPLFSFTFRASHTPAPKSSQCNFAKAENFFHLTDDVTHVSLEQDKFSAVSVTGALINNVAEYKKEVSDSVVAANPTATSSLSISAPMTVKKSDEDEKDEKVIVVDRTFQWRLDDIDIGPMFFGVITSVKTNTVTTTDVSVYGLDKALPYLNCL